MTSRGFKRKELASSVSPEATRSKKHQGGDICVVCNAVIGDEDECSIPCQWCGSWKHSKCANISNDECAILGKSSTRLVFLCATCTPRLDEALEYYDDNHANHPSTDGTLVKQDQLESKLAVVETKLQEIKELASQLSKCREMLNTSEVNSTKPPSGPTLIANTVFTTMNEEKDKEKRQNVG